MCLITAQWDEAASPREPEGSSLPVVIFFFFCLCASPCAFHPPLPPFWFLLRTGLQSEGEPDSEMCATKRWCKKDVLAKVIMVFISHGVTPRVDRTVFMLCAQNQCIQFCFCFLHRTFLQHDSWGEDRRRQQISLRRKCKTCMSVFSSYWACFFTPLIWLHCFKKSQVDYGATADELEIHFNGCGPVNRVTILCDRFSGHPKGWVQLVHTDYYIRLTLEYNYKACWHLFFFSLPFAALLTLSSLIETPWLALLVCMRRCSGEESLRWGA